MDIERKALKFLSVLYDASLDEKKWPQVLDQLSLLFNASSSSLMYQNTQNQNISFFKHSTSDTGAFNDYVNYYYYKDERVERGMKTLPGTFQTDYTLVPKDRFLNSEIYNDFLKPNNLRHMLGSLLIKNSYTNTYIGVHRSANQGYFDSDEFALAKIIFPHIKKAVQIYEKLGHNQYINANLLYVLNKSPSGIIILNESLEPVIYNNAFQTISDQNDGLNLSTAGLSASHQVTNGRLQNSLQHCLTLNTNVLNNQQDDLLLIPRRSKKRDYVLSIMPTPITLRMNDSASCLIIMNDPMLKQEVNLTLLMSLYPLTSAEAKLSNALINGYGLDEYAHRAKLKISYVRSILKSVFLKTQTNRQSELIILLNKMMVNLK